MYTAPLEQVIRCQYFDDKGFNLYWDEVKKLCKNLKNIHLLLTQYPTDTICNTMSHKGMCYVSEYIK